MKFKWGKRSLTFMVIPDASRKVVRFRISTLLLYITPIAILSIICVTLFVHLENVKTALEKERLASELADKKQLYEQTLHHKDATIAQLQSEILDIAEQTEDVKLKVNELKRLEEEIRDVTASEKEEKDKGKGQVSIASVPEPRMETRGMGGRNEELSGQDTETLISMTKNELSKLDQEASELIASISISKDALIEHLRLMRITPSIWPTISYDTSSSYGYRRDPFTRKMAFHSGIDISGNTGDPIFVTAEGIVTSVGYDRSYGYNVIVKHASGLQTRYGHLKKYTVKVGQLLSQGEQLGLLGSTGRSTGPHLHYEVIKNGTIIDPMPYLQAAGKDEK